MNLVVVIFCIYFTNAFLDGTFNDLGYKWMEAYLRTDEVIMMKTNLKSIISVPE
jgi:hypothetical protein